MIRIVLTDIEHYEYDGETVLQGKMVPEDGNQMNALYELAREVSWTNNGRCVVMLESEYDEAVSKLEGALEALK
jgi:hypothetical protein